MIPTHAQSQPAKVQNPPNPTTTHAQFLIASLALPTKRAVAAAPGSSLRIRPASPRKLTRKSRGLLHLGQVQLIAICICLVQ
ncbi:unnamed protein product [Urochloa humidicola]